MTLNGRSEYSRLPLDVTPRTIEQLACLPKRVTLGQVFFYSFSGIFASPRAVFSVQIQKRDRCESFPAVSAMNKMVAIVIQ